MNKLTVEDMDLRGKRVLMRVDFNVPLEGGVVANDKRIRAALPTIEYIAANGGRLILMSHLGRPKGKKVPEMSLRPAAERLGELLGQEVKLAPDCIGDEVESMAQKLQPGQVLLLENLRFAGDGLVTLMRSVTLIKAEAPKAAQDWVSEAIREWDGARRAATRFLKGKA